MKKLIITLLLLFSFVVSYSQNTLHWIIVGDNRGETNIGDACSGDIASMKRLQKDIEALNIFKPHRIVIEEGNFNPNCIEDTLTNLKVNSGDIVFFYVSSHGFRIKDIDKSPFPRILFNGNVPAIHAGVPFMHYIEILKNKNPKGIIGFVDACNNIVSSNEVVINSTSKGNGFTNNLSLKASCVNYFFNTVFEQIKKNNQVPTILISAAQQNSKAIAEGNNSLTTRVFVSTLRAFLSQESSNLDIKDIKKFCADFVESNKQESQRKTTDCMKRGQDCDYTTYLPEIIAGDSLLVRAKSLDGDSVDCEYVPYISFNGDSLAIKEKPNPYIGLYSIVDIVPASEGNYDTLRFNLSIIGDSLERSRIKRVSYYLDKDSLEIDAIFRAAIKPNFEISFSASTYYPIYIEILYENRHEPKRRILWYDLANTSRLGPDVLIED